MTETPDNTDGVEPPERTGRRHLGPRREDPHPRRTRAVVLGAATLLLFAAVGIHGNGDYGFLAFLGAPLAQGIVVGAIIGKGPRPRTGQAVGAVIWGVLLACFVLFLAAQEGAICLVMALPLWVPIGLLGTFLGLGIAESVPRSGRVNGLGVLLALPLLAVAERATDGAPPLLEVRSEVVVDAPPGIVWDHVIRFSELPAPRDWLFRTGIAYPIRAEIDGSGPGAVRRCVFSTGAFVEPITVWDEPRRLAFRVAENPAPMKEFSLWEQVHAPHLQGYFASEKGEFLLEEMPDGKTRLTGTTWYRHDLRPAAYWRLWSDWVIHRIHLRVLNHIRKRAEAGRES